MRQIGERIVGDAAARQLRGRVVAERGGVQLRMRVALQAPHRIIGEVRRAPARAAERPHPAERVIIIADQRDRAAILADRRHLPVGRMVVGQIEPVIMRQPRAAAGKIVLVAERAPVLRHPVPPPQRIVAVGEAGDARRG